MRNQRRLWFLVALAVIGAAWLAGMYLLADRVEVLGCTWDREVGASEECTTDG